MAREDMFPKCSSDCEIVKMLGAGECESVCPQKFDKDGKPLNKLAVMVSFCANKQCVLMAKSGRCGMVENCDSFKAQIAP